MNSLRSAPAPSAPGPPLRGLAILRGLAQFAWLLVCVACVFAFAFAAWLILGALAHWYHRPLPGARLAILVGGVVGWCLMVAGYHGIDDAVLRVFRHGNAEPVRLIRRRNARWNIRSAEDLGHIVVSGERVWFKGLKRCVELSETPTGNSPDGLGTEWRSLDSEWVAVPCIPDARRVAPTRGNEADSADRT